MEPRRAAAVSNMSARRLGPVARFMGRLQARVYRRTGGRLGGRFMGKPVFVLETVGRRSGEPRATPLMYVPHGDDLLVLAANAGNDRTPAWWLNLAAAGAATAVLRGGDRRRVRPRLPEGEERERLTEVFFAAYPPSESYGGYTDREMPLVVLEPADGG